LRSHEERYRGSGEIAPSRDHRDTHIDVLGAMSHQPEAFHHIDQANRIRRDELAARRSHHPRHSRDHTIASRPQALGATGDAEPTLSSVYDLAAALNI
jgi:hypothetical protein